MTAIPKAVLNARLREERKALGLVELRLWVPPGAVDTIKSYAKRMNVYHARALKNAEN